LTTVEPVYGTVIALVRTVWRVQGLRFTIIGQQNIPATGGAVIAINHTSYFDFTLAGLPAFREHRARKNRLKAGELVAVYPEATISRSFEIKEFKSGAARMAIEADVPIIPHIVWGAQRIWTKDHPKKLFRPKVPIVVLVGEPIQPTLPAPELTSLLHSRMEHLLEQAQDAYGSHPAGEWWVPHRLGGGAPTLAEAAQLDAEEADQRAAARAAREAGPAE
jgi:1-acyl-sn-glycerol-3-phosphate acyltransferase